MRVCDAAGIPVQINPSVVIFSAIPDGTSATQSFLITNSGGTTVTGSVGKPPPSQPFSVTANGGPFSLASGASLSASIRFAPRVAGTYNAALKVTAGPKKTMLKVQLSGVGTAVPSGKVVIIGGVTNLSVILASSEIYDSATGQFTPSGTMGDSRGFQTATWLDPSVVKGPLAGEIFVTGGEDDSHNVVPTTELYSVQAGSFGPGPLMSDGRGEHTATLIPSGPLAGQVLVIGGEDNNLTPTKFFLPINLQELYNPATDGFTRTGKMSDARGEHTATLIQGCNCPRDGLVLVTGGVDDNINDRHKAPVALKTAELFDPSTGTFSCVGGVDQATGRCNDTMSVARWEHAATLLLDGRVLITGGVTTNFSSSSGTQSADIYDPVANAISPTKAPMHVGRQGQTSTLIQGCNCAADAKVLIAGGQNQKGQTTPAAELFDPASGTFTLTKSMNSPRATHTATLFTSGDLAGWVLITGGLETQNGRVLNTAELYDPLTDSFKKTGSMHAARNEHTATLLPP